MLLVLSFHKSQAVKSWLSKFSSTTLFDVTHVSSCFVNEVICLSNHSLPSLSPVSHPDKHSPLGICSFYPPLSCFLRLSFCLLCSSLQDPSPPLVFATHCHFFPSFCCLLIPHLHLFSLLIISQCVACQQVSQSSGQNITMEMDHRV